MGGPVWKLARKWQKTPWNKQPPPSTHSDSWKVRGQPPILLSLFAVVFHPRLSITLLCQLGRGLWNDARNGNITVNELLAQCVAGWLYTRHRWHVRIETTRRGKWHLSMPSTANNLVISGDFNANHSYSRLELSWSPSMLGYWVGVERPGEVWQGMVVLSTCLDHLTRDKRHFDMCTGWLRKMSLNEKGQWWIETKTLM